MTEFPDLHACTLGSTSFQLQDFKLREDPIVVGSVRVGSKIAIDGVGYMQADTPGGFATALAQTFASFRVSGQDFEIFGVGGVSLIKLTNATCRRGGPYVSFDMLEGVQTPALQRAFRFRVLADTILLPDATDDGTSATRSVDTRPDGLRVITWAGELTGDNVADRFAAVVGDFRDTYAWPRWVTSHRFDLNATGDVGGFQITGKELRGDLPVGPIGEAVAIDGDAVMRRGRDEQMRLTRVWDYDLLITGIDYQQVVDRLRANVQAIVGETTPILRESVQVTLISELRLRASFETLAGGDGNPLLNWTQSIRVVRPADVYSEVRYAGADPLLVREPAPVARLVQSGSAIGAGVWIMEPPPLGDAYLAEPDVSYSLINGVERQTSWSYVRAYDTAVPLAGMTRPATPEIQT